MTRLFLSIICSLMLSESTLCQTNFIFKEKNSDTQIGVIDEKGQIIIKNEFNRIQMKSGYILATKELSNKVCIFRSDGKLIKNNVTDFQELGNCKFILLKEFRADRDGKWGLFKIDGNKVLDFKYDNILRNSLTKDYAQVTKDNRYILIDTLGNEIYSNSNIDDFKTYSINLKNENEIGYELNMDIEDVGMFEVFKDEKKLKYGIQLDNKIVVQPKYDEVIIACCDRFIVKENSKYGVINEKGLVILETIFDKIENIGNYEIIACFNEKYGVYNSRTGEILIKPSFGYLNFLK